MDENAVKVLEIGIQYIVVIGLISGVLLYRAIFTAYTVFPIVKYVHER